jgi:hypothetical protein
VVYRERGRWARLVRTLCLTNKFQEQINRHGYLSMLENFKLVSDPRVYPLRHTGQDH